MAGVKLTVRDVLPHEVTTVHALNGDGRICWSCHLAFTDGNRCPNEVIWERPWPG